MSRARLPRREADIDVPSECREHIDRGALVAINTSGGKDSQAMTILLSRLIPPDQLVAVHAPLGEVEWPGTVEHIENTIPSGVPLIIRTRHLRKDPARTRWRRGGCGPPSPPKLVHIGARNADRSSASCAAT